MAIERNERVYFAMRALAKANARGEKTSKVPVGDLTCAYFPLSGTYAWFAKGSDITKALTKRQVLSLINIELGENDHNQST